MAKILIVEDNTTLREGVAAVIKRMGHDAHTAPNGRHGLAAFQELRPDLIISDLKMDEMDGMTLLRKVHEIEPETLVMIITAFGSIERAVDAMKEGAFDFIPKPFPPDLLRTKVAKALQVRDERRQSERLRQENEMLREELGARDGGQNMIGTSAAIQKVFRTLEKVARAASTVYIFGESGTGKELAAHAIHQHSPRAAKPFVKVNCSALAETLLESELFGHEKGSFTGAHKRKLGRFELADGGTIFLDEIGDISPSIQLKLLRVLQEQAFERVGGESTVNVDVRVVTATNKDLKQEVEAGRFREDLFYRLHIIPIVLPPLRERADDVEPLISHFIDKLGRRTRSDVTGVEDDALRALKSYGWPGNIRELENVIEHALVFADNNLITLDDLPAAISGVSRDDLLNIPDGDRSLPEILEDLERQLILRAYRAARGVKTETARQLGIKASALYYKLEKYDIDDSVLPQD